MAWRPSGGVARNQVQLRLSLERATSASNASTTLTPARATISAHMRARNRQSAGVAPRQAPAAMPGIRPDAAEDAWLARARDHQLHAPPIFAGNVTLMAKPTFQALGSREEVCCPCPTRL